MRYAPAQALLIGSFLFSATAASAQTGQTIFADDFESGLADWTATGQWNLEADTDGCGSTVAPFMTGSQGAWYGNDEFCIFGIGASVGHLTTIEPFDIPLDAGQVTLTFNSYDDTECASCDWDWRFVYVSRNGGETWDFVGESGELGWHETQIDLSPYVGNSLLLRFEFDQVDFHANDGLGWLIDDVRVEIGGCDLPSNYCEASINSSGSAASMGYSGSVSILANDLGLLVEGAAPNQSGMFFYGSNQASTPYGNGTLCVGPGSGSFYRLAPVVMTDGWGDAAVQLDNTTGVLGFGPGQVSAGSTWNFSYWFRDPNAGGAGFNYSDGLEVVFCQ